MGVEVNVGEADEPAEELPAEPVAEALADAAEASADASVQVAQIQADRDVEIERIRADVEREFQQRVTDAETIRLQYEGELAECRATISALETRIAEQQLILDQSSREPQPPPSLPDSADAEVMPVNPEVQGEVTPEPARKARKVRWI